MQIRASGPEICEKGHLFNTQMHMLMQGRRAPGLLACPNNYYRRSRRGILGGSKTRKTKAKEEREEGNVSASPRRVGSTVQEKIEDRSTLAATVVAPLPLPYNETCLSVPRVDCKRRAERLPGGTKDDSANYLE